VDISAVPGVITLNPPASAGAVAALRGRLPAELPGDYTALLARADGVVADRFVLYSCEDLPERNETFEVGEYAPGYVAVGDDNGGSAIVMRGGPGLSPVFLVGHGTMQPADMVELAVTLSDWIAAGCPLRAGA
jgi:hypothetical protein